MDAKGSGMYKQRFDFCFVHVPDPLLFFACILIHEISALAGYRIHIYTPAPPWRNSSRFPSGDFMQKHLIFRGISCTNPPFASCLYMKNSVFDGFSVYVYLNTGSCRAMRSCSTHPKLYLRTISVIISAVSSMPYLSDLKVIS